MTIAIKLLRTAADGARAAQYLAKANNRPVSAFAAGLRAALIEVKIAEQKNGRV